MADTPRYDKYENQSSTQMSKDTGKRTSDKYRKSLPSQIDWRTRGYVTKVKNQVSTGIYFTWEMFYNEPAFINIILMLYFVSNK